MPITECPACGTGPHALHCKSGGWDVLRCGQCGSLRLYPLPTTEELTRHYSSRASKGNYELSKAVERVPTLRQIFKVASQAPLRPGDRFLDLCCFDGGLLDIALQAGCETWGLEMQGEAARSAHAKHEGRIHFGTVEAFVPVERDFQVITAVGAIEHLLQPTRLVEIAWECLRPGGLLLLQTPNAGSMPAKLLGRHWPCLAAPEHIHYFTQRGLEKLLKARGFTDIRYWAHFKPLRVGYVIEQLRYWGASLHSLMEPVLTRVPSRVRALTLRMYGGEMIVTARKAALSDEKA